MPDEVKRTPLEVRKHIEGHFMITDTEGTPVAVTDTVERAELFVRAVNAHDDLMTIARTYRDSLGTTNGQIEIMNHIDAVLTRVEAVQP